MQDCGWRSAIENVYTGGGATAAGMGHLAVMDDSEAQFALTSYSQALWHELAVELPPAAEYLPCGALWIAADQEELDEAQRKFRSTERAICLPKCWTPRNLRRPNLSCGPGWRVDCSFRPIACAIHRVRPSTWRAA